MQSGRLDALTIEQEVCESAKGEDAGETKGD
jgi:hypothetical protein